MNNMKIAHVVCVTRPYKGGVGEVAYYYSLELAQLGHEVSIFALAQNKQDEGVQYEKGVTIHRVLPKIKYGKAGYIFSLVSKLKNFDIIHIHMPFFGTAELVWWYSFFKKKHQKIVVTYHMDVHHEGFLGKYINWYQKNITPKILRCADKILVSSIDYIQHSSISKIYQTNPQKFIELPFGVDSMFHVKKPVNTYSKYSLDENSNIILFVGGLDAAHYFKGVPVLLEAFSKIEQHAKLVIVGKGENKEKFEQIARDLHISNDVIFTGFVDDQELVDLYNMANVCVLPSTEKNEAFGIVLIQAMACKKPVIASNLPGVRVVVENNKNGFLVQPNNAKDLADKIDTLLLNPHKAEEFGNYGYRKQKMEYEWVHIAKNLDEIYFQL